MGKTNKEIYFSVNREQAHLRTKKTTMRDRLRRMRDSPMLRGIARRLEGLETFLSRRLVLSVDLLRVLGTPDPTWRLVAARSA